MKYFIGLMVTIAFIVGTTFLVATTVCSHKPNSAAPVVVGGGGSTRHDPNAGGVVTLYAEGPGGVGGSGRIVQVDSFAELQKEVERLRATIHLQNSNIQLIANKLQYILSGTNISYELVPLNTK